MELLVTLAIFGVVLLSFYMLYRWLRLPQFPTSVCRQFVERSRGGPVAHRAGKPENTLAGIRKAKLDGASAVEVDLTFTRDGVPVLLHDKTVDRTSNGSGKLSELTFEEVRKLNFGDDNGSECIPTLDEALSLCEELELQMYLEVKNGHDKAVATICDCLKRSPSLYNLVAVVSFCPFVLYKLRVRDPNINCGFLLIGTMFALGNPSYKPLWMTIYARCSDWTLKWCAKNWLLSFIGVKMLLPQKELLLSGAIDPPSYWKEKEISLVTWTVNKKEEKSIMETELKIPFLSDCVNPDFVVPEQFEVHKHH